MLGAEHSDDIRAAVDPKPKPAERTMQLFGRKLVTGSPIPTGGEPTARPADLQQERRFSTIPALCVPQTGLAR